MRDRLIEIGGHDVDLVEGGGGVFEIEVENELRFSKKKLGRFPNDDEIDALVAG